MYIIAGLLAGLAGTMVMTLFTTSFSVVFKRSFFVIKILDTMLVGNSSPEISRLSAKYHLALVLHYGIGAIFSYVFLSLVSLEIIEFNFLKALIFGASIGVVAVSGWMVLLSLYPFFGQLNRIEYLTVIWFGHILFALGMFSIYQPLLSLRLTDAITVCQ